MIPMLRGELFYPSFMRKDVLGGLLVSPGVPSAHMGKGQSLRNDFATASLPNFFLIRSVSISSGTHISLEHISLEVEGRSRVIQFASEQLRSVALWLLVV